MKTGGGIKFLYTNIGRGHPFYLDGIKDELVRSGRVSMIRESTDVFEVSKGLSSKAWRLVRWLYVKGPSDDIIGRLYTRLRADNRYSDKSILVRVLSSKIRKYFGKQSDRVIVAHPLLVAALASRTSVYYQHGELIAPGESIVPGAELVFVPTEEVAERFISAGYGSDRVIVTGLCIEPDLVRQAKDAYSARLRRLQSANPLTMACFSSGAEPLAHAEKIIMASLSAVMAGEGVIVFARRGGLLERGLKIQMERHSVQYEDLYDTDQLPRELPPLLLVTFSNRRELDARTAQLFPFFDYILSPPHERTNWAVGLGLPMFVLTPVVGPFAPLNLQFLRRSGVAYVVDESVLLSGFARTLEELKSDGSLIKMSQAGWQRFAISGFTEIANQLQSRHDGTGTIGVDS